MVPQGGSLVEPTLDFVAGGSRKTPGVPVHRDLRGAWVGRPVCTVIGTYRTRRLYVETGTRMFQRDGKKSGATQWVTWVLRINGDVRPNTSELRAYNVVLFPRWRVPGTPGTGGVGPEGPDPTPGVKGRKAPKGTQTC